MEKMLKEFERVLDRKIYSVKELEILLTRMYNNKLEEVADNYIKAFDELDDNIKQLFEKYEIIIKTVGNENWNVEPRDAYEYTNVYNILNTDNIKSARSIVDDKVEKYMKENNCSNIHAFSKVCENLFGDEKPFILDSDYEQPVVIITDSDNVLNRTEDADSILFIESNEAMLSHRIIK